MSESEIIATLMNMLKRIGYAINEDERLAIGHAIAAIGKSEIYKNIIKTED